MNLRVALPIAAAVLLVASMGWAQFGRGGYTGLMARMAQPDSADGRFHYCRAMYRANMGGDGGNWLTDYPLADIDLSIRLAELTKTRSASTGMDNPSTSSCASLMTRCSSARSS